MRRNKAPGGTTGKKSRTISVRLHPDDEYERAALAEFDKLLSEGFSARQIITHAILDASGHTPEMYRDSRTNPAMHQIQQQLDALTHMFDEHLGELLRSIKNADPDAFRRFANHDDADGRFDLDTDFMANARTATRRTWQQRKGK